MPAAATEQTVTTRRVFTASPAQIWDVLLFYEQIEQRPPWLLRILLPTPERTEGAKSAVGDEARCIYDSGHLVKRVTAIDPGRRYEFEITEQCLAVRGLALHGGHYALRERPDGGTVVETATRYRSPRRPRWLWQPIEAFVCHRFHHHLLGAMQRRLQAC